MATKKKTEEVTETNPVRKVVTLTKDDLSYTLTDAVMISAFLNQGYEEV